MTLEIMLNKIDSEKLDLQVEASTSMEGIDSSYLAINFLFYYTAHDTENLIVNIREKIKELLGKTYIIRSSICYKSSKNAHWIEIKILTKTILFTELEQRKGKLSAVFSFLKDKLGENLFLKIVSDIIKDNNSSRKKYSTLSLKVYKELTTLLLNMLSDDEKLFIELTILS